ncbi:MAG: hypothetical protein AAFY91_04275, partial [Bacteroidota bacterium]
MEILQDLEDISSSVWAELTKAHHQKRHPWRTPAMGNVAGNELGLRTIVLRKSDTSSRRIRFYTDKRSAKWMAVERGVQFAILFWNPKKSWQLQMHGSTLIVDQEQTHHIWASLPVHSRSSYATKLAPGSPLPGPDNGLADHFFDMSLEETAYAEAHFAVFDIVVDRFESLQLSRNGHRRAKFKWEENSQNWDGQWI